MTEGGTTIELSLLAKHDFDLRGKLGRLLRDKFKFSSPGGIAKAYESLFVDTRRDKKVEAFSFIGEDPKLIFLQQFRHLIVHKAGVVDERFKELPSVTREIGERIIVDEKAAAGAINTAIDAGVALMQRVNDELSHLDSRRQKSAIQTVARIKEHKHEA